MIEEIGNVQKCIDEALSWIKRNKPEQYDVKFLHLVEERRKIRKIERAAKEKPAIAAFGESQKGKSYLMGNLLQNRNETFRISVDGRSGDIDFVRSINPIGDKKEATGVVTRFTPFNTGTDRYNPKLPVIVKLLTVGNIATILCDSYYHDINDSKQYSDDDIKTISETIYDKYLTRPVVVNSPVVADDVLEIKSYVGKYVNQLQNITRSSYFEKLALIIDRVNVSELIDVFKYLWHENEVISNLFVRLVNALERLSFADEVYVPIEAVLHNGKNKNTILSVDCLNGLDDSDWNLNTDVYIGRNSAEQKLVANFPKCELCAICSEVVFKIDTEYLHEERSYSYDATRCGEPGYMSVDTMNKLSKSVSKDLLASSDLLDFPGARNRLKIKESFLNIVNEQEGISNIVQLLLRGKVAFLFNNYSESRIINILLFCHDNEQPSVTDMYVMINDWVEKYVGDNAMQRRATIDKCGGVAPLFVIGTKFNVDMIEADSAVLNSSSALNQRWEGRFNKVLFTQIFKAGDVDWFKNWDAPNSSFKNCYMLRDYKYSGNTGSGNNIYGGYQENVAGSEETELLLSGDFYQSLKQSFVENDDVQRFFNDPALSWDVAASINNDGALYIIDRLSVVAKNANKTRADQFDADLATIRQKIHALIYGYYVPEHDSEIIEANIRKATAIIREMDFTCNEDNYYFGRLIQSMQMTEAECVKIVHDILHDSDVAIEVHDFKEYELIRARCDNFAGCYDENDKWERIMRAYGFINISDAQRYMSGRAINYALLFSGEYKKKRNSSIIVKRIMEYWAEKMRSISFMNNFTGKHNFDAGVMSDCVSNLLSVARSIKLAEVMEQMISEQVDVVNVATANEVLISDLLATTISEFVTDCGYSYLSAESIQKARQLANEYRLTAFNYINREQKSSYTEEEMTQIFNDMNDNPKAITASFENSYNSWLEYMVISHIAHVEARVYNIEENRLLATILNMLS